MRYSLLLSILGVLLALLGLQAGWPWSIPLVWLALNFVALGVAHSRGGHGIFGKRPDGTLRWWSWVLFLPLLLYTAAVWHLIRLISREAAVNRLTERIAIGRRLLPGELKESFSNHVDLTAEFQEPDAYRSSAGYFAFPILDAAAPNPEHLAQAIESLKEGPVFIHCAQGHGRTGLFALALLLSSRAVGSLDEGLDLLAKARPAVRLNRSQLACARAFAALHKEPDPSS
ncbi:tyrosine-protein phosphatase [Haloferula sp. BvORR071]|uniref:tyrosine-protein phosphatase n=1 Tax=Haloferula sp. BvORR071 TaxID=1396141 RepID=UPI0006972802|nr:tyrosine-protein phosphatase [Haloferula sp. BvORR071]